MLGVGYVMGTKAGRRRYEQIVRTYKAVTASPVTKTVIDSGRRQIAKRVSPDPMGAVTEIDEVTVYEPPKRR
ncbi:hypothetical protein MBRU_11115 [Mycolicibacterium brumae DSM 44177]|nr:hypothetical protein MBRU_11115 [Mycolicibacterium brumae DSM 44177]